MQRDVGLFSNKLSTVRFVFLICRLIFIESPQTFKLQYLCARKANLRYYICFHKRYQRNAIRFTLSVTKFAIGYKISILNIMFRGSNVAIVVHVNKLNKFTMYFFNFWQTFSHFSVHICLSLIHI